MPIKTSKLSNAHNRKVVANPVDTYSRPTPKEVRGTPVGPHPLSLLAGALGRFSVALSGYSEREKAKTNKKEEVDAMHYAYGIKDKDLVNTIRNNEKVPDSVYKATVDAGAGTRIANKTIEDLTLRYQGQNTAPDGSPSNAFNRNTGNLDEWFNNAISQGADEIGDSVEGRAAYFQRMEQARRQFHTEQNNFIEKRYHEEAVNNAQELFLNTTDEMVANGATPQEIHSQIRSLYPNLRSVSHLTNKEIDNIVMDVARLHAQEGRLGLVKELLLSSRDGAPAIGRKKSNVSEALSLLKTADRNRRTIIKETNKELITHLEVNADEGTLDEKELKDFVTKFPDVLTPDEISDMRSKNESAQFKAKQDLEKFEIELKHLQHFEIEQKKLDTILLQKGDHGLLQNITNDVEYRDEKGIFKTYKATVLQQRAIDNYLVKSAKQAEIRNETPEQKFDRDVSFFSKNGVANKEWENVLNGGYTAATPEALSSDNIPPSLLEGVEIYKQLRAKSPLALKLHLKSQTAQDFYDLYSVARELGHTDDRQAIVAATMALKSVNDDNTTIKAFSDKEIKEAYNDNDGWFSSIPTFNGEIQTDVRRLATLYAKLGLAPEEALKKASERVSKDFSDINGRAVRTSDVHILGFQNLVARVAGSTGVDAATFPNAVMDYLEDYAEASGHDVDDLSIANPTQSPGSWVVINKTTSLPVANAKGMDAIITLDSLAKREAEKLKALQDKTAKDVVKSHSKSKKSSVAKDEALTGLIP